MLHKENDVSTVRKELIHHLIYYVHILINICLGIEVSHTLHMLTLEHYIAEDFLNNNTSLLWSIYSTSIGPKIVSSR